MAILSDGCPDLIFEVIVFVDRLESLNFLFELVEEFQKLSSDLTEVYD